MMRYENARGAMRRRADERRVTMVVSDQSGGCCFFVSI